MALAKIHIRKQWIASSNAEWLAFGKGTGGVRGGISPATAMARFAERHPEIFAEGATVHIVVERDTTRALSAAITQPKASL